MSEREPRQASLRRLRSFGIRPNRELGQNFLIDDNILRVIGAAAELDAGDVVLEVGGGLGVLSEFLAPLVAHLHVVEVDRSLEPPLREALEPFGNVTLHLADAVRMDFAELEPSPTKVVANLPYGVAATVLLKSIAELPGAGALGGDGPARGRGPSRGGARAARATARPPCSRSSRARSASCERCRAACSSPSRTWTPRSWSCAAARPRRTDELVALVHAGFAHRRKALAGSLALTPGAPDDVRDATRAALEQLGHPADARAERLPPEDWPRLAEAIGRERLAGLRPARAGRPGRRARSLPPMLHERAYAKLNLVLHVGRPREDGLHPICSLMASIDLADELTATAARVRR